MRLDEATCWELLGDARRAVLGTAHPDRGVDAVPVVLALLREGVVLPLDRVKDKRGGKLQRVANIERDPRCVLLADHYAEDWSRLWWVRVHGRASVLEGAELDEARAALAARYTPYQEPGSIAGALLVRPEEITGWSAHPPGRGRGPRRSRRS